MINLVFTPNTVICPCSIYGSLLWDKLWEELLAAEELQGSYIEFSCSDCRETYRMPILFSEIL